MAGLWLPIWHTYLAHLAPITVSPILHPLSMASPLTSCYRNSLLICCFKFSVMNSLVICGAPTLTLFCMCQSDALFVQSAIISFFLYSCGQVLTLLEVFFYVKKYRFLSHNLIVSMCRHDCRLEIDHEKQARHGKEKNLAGSKLNLKNGRRVSTRGQEGCAETRQKGH